MVVIMAIGVSVTTAVVEEPCHPLLKGFGIDSILYLASLAQ